MSLVRTGVALSYVALVLLTASQAAAQSVEAQLISKMAAISAETDRRTAGFMRDIAPRLASLRLDNLSTPENLVSHEGRAAIRAGYRALSQIIDELDAFDRAEEARVGDALSAATLGIPADVAKEVEAGFMRGYSRTSARHARLRATQRQSIRRTLELVDVIDSLPGGVSLARGRLVFADRETELRVSRLFAELARLEVEEQRAEREIMENRGSKASHGDLMK